MRDLPYPEGISRKLTYLTEEHGIPVLAANAHRALDDAMLVVQILRHYDWKTQVEPYWKAPEVTLIAEFSKGDPQAKALAKPFGFHWQPERMQWEKKARDFGDDLEILRAKLYKAARITVRVSKCQSAPSSSYRTKRGGKNPRRPRSRLKAVK